MGNGMERGGQNHEKESGARLGEGNMVRKEKRKLKEGEGSG
jgi:hypothetical protein